MRNATDIIRLVRLPLAIVIAVSAGDGFAQKTATQRSAAQRSPTQRPTSKPAATVICPQAGVVGKSNGSRVALKGVKAFVTINCDNKTTAETKLRIQTSNSARTPYRCDIVLPVQKGTSVSGVWSGAAKEGGKASGHRATTGPATDGTALSNDVSCTYCQSTTFLNRSQSLLEFFGYDFLRLPNVNIPAGSNGEVAVNYRQTLTNTGSRYDYVLPKSELLAYRIPWGINATIRSQQPIATVYSPSHPISWNRDAKTGVINVRVHGNATDEPGSFRLSWLQETGGINGTVFGYPPTKSDDGYFLLLLAPGHKVPTERSQKREVTLVIDRSASTRGKQISEVRKVTDNVLKELRLREKFNVVSYNENITSFSKNPVGNTLNGRNSAKTYIQQLKPRGGSNIYDALKTALEQPATPNMVPIVLFFTDGMPTVGRTSESAIRKLVAASNKANRRIYTFGVGVDLNTPLLQGIADATRGRATFVLPKEDIAKKVGAVVKRLKYPIMTDNEFVATDASGKKAARPRAAMVYPQRLPDIFAGEQLIILGRYRGTEKIPFVIRGKYLGQLREFRFVFDPSTASRTDQFVPRLWAGRRIAELVENIRTSGASRKPDYAVRSQKPHPKVRELSAEILKLTAEHGVLTEYTAFLSGGKKFDTYRQSLVFKRLITNFDNRAVRSRSGYGSVNQEVNAGNMKGQSRVNGRNLYWGPKMNPVSVSNVQQLGNGAYFRYGNTWVDGRLMNNSAIPQPKRTITFGSKDYELLLNQLAKKGQQGALALDGKVLLLRKSGPVLVVPPTVRNTK